MAISNEDFFAEVKKRTGCTLADLGDDPDDQDAIDHLTAGHDTAQDAVTELIAERGLDDLTAPWGL